MWYPCLESVSGSVSHSLKQFAGNEWNLYEALHGLWSGRCVFPICLVVAGRRLMLVSVIGVISMCLDVLNQKTQQFMTTRSHVGGRTAYIMKNIWTRIN